MIPFVIVAAKTQMDRVDRLVKHIYALDGTKVVVIPKKEPNEAYPECCNSAFHQAALLMKGNAFGWLEPDSVPIKPGWAKLLEEEYYRLGKPFMLSSDYNPPNDLTGAIGIYGPDSHWMIPANFSHGSWDWWMLKHIPDLISKTPLIFHSYGDYSTDPVRPWMFPKDSKVIREDAVIVHRDRFQGLLGEKSKPRFAMSNDCGDFIACLPVIRQLGGGHITIGNHADYPKNGMRDSRKYYEEISLLLSSVSYIESVSYAEDHHNAEYNLTGWRTSYNRYRTLSDSQAHFLGLNNLDVSPWLTAEPDPRTKGKIVIARTSRYPNHSFPWMEAARRYRGRLVFLGLREEHQEWEKNFRGNSEYIPTKDFLEVAGLIQGSDFCIMNQTCSGWIAMALGKKLIQESCIWALDSKVDRHNNQYVDGSIVEWPK